VRFRRRDKGSKPPTERELREEVLKRVIKMQKTLKALHEAAVNNADNGGHGLSVSPQVWMNFRLDLGRVHWYLDRNQERRPWYKRWW